MRSLPRSASCPCPNQFLPVWSLTTYAEPSFRWRLTGAALMPLGIAEFAVADFYEQLLNELPVRHENWVYLRSRLDCGVGHGHFL
jgi:hypothetical protein